MINFNFQRNLGNSVNRLTSNRVLGFIAICIFVGTTTAQEPRLEVEARQDGWKQHQKMASESPFKDLKWQTMGPKFAGGRIESIDAPRDDLGTIYVGVGAGGVWKTVNGGLTWKPIFDQESTFAIGDLTIAPSDSSTIWVGTGECHVGRMSYSGTGVFSLSYYHG